MSAAPLMGILTLADRDQKSAVAAGFSSGLSSDPPAAPGGSYNADSDSS